MGGGPSATGGRPLGRRNPNRDLNGWGSAILSRTTAS
jgi:hypothetical protein